MTREPKQFNILPAKLRCHYLTPTSTIVCHVFLYLGFPFCCTKNSEIDATSAHSLYMTGNYAAN